MTKDALARRADAGLSACAVRLIAARKVTGLASGELAGRCGVSPTAYSNMERGLSFPNRPVMLELHRSHRIDFNFMIYGDYAQLPGDVQNALFEALPAAANEWDRKSNSGRDRPRGRTSKQA
ncbi:helix-turn-helix transcriptional regulator [Palleronia sp. LCG004]|uniref:helix-turn-helix domain-containing protein n=1 Tax=Palleronia sp. LCG004 TaxID=3079304 RepID=UPI00294384A3|nr:helix-turn-helix transcriptional regulator [Palleronia sp. LCG004]WOI54975.1 helix-turn-helix transcriptional regulator [Palleronia sp. LCG004]